MNLRLGYYLPWLMSMSWTVAGKRNGTSAGGGGLKEVFGWSVVTFRFPSKGARELAEASGRYRPENCLPLGIEVYGGRLFVSVPRWKPGVPATLGVVPLDAPDGSPPLEPYPDWTWHDMDNCNGLVSVFRMSVDTCGRLWVLDSGKVDVASAVKSVCPAQILVFDLHTDRLLWRYRIPKEQTPPGALLTNIAVDVRDGDCNDAFAYASDVFRYGLVVYSFLRDRSWRVEHPYFFPDPLLSKYEIDGLRFSWTDGVFGLALSPVAGPSSSERNLYFHPLSGSREFSVPASYLRNETRGRPGEGEDPFRVVGGPRRRLRPQSTGSAMDRSGVLFYNLVARASVGCWNSNLGDHRPATHGLVAKDQTSLSFPNDLKVDNEPEQSLWVLSNRLHKYLYSRLSHDEVNFRVLRAKVKDAVKGTPCQPGSLPPPQKRQKKKCHQP